MQGSSFCYLYQYVLVSFCPFQIQVLNLGYQAGVNHEEEEFGRINREKVASQWLFQKFSWFTFTLLP